MMDPRERAVAVVGLGAVLPDAPDAPSFWANVAAKRYSITEVPKDRWSADDYWDPDPSAPDKTYSKIGAWVRGFQFDWKKYLIPPRVASVMDEGQQWAVAIAQQALDDYGYPARPLDTERTGVILGAAMGGELHYLTSLRIHFPHLRNALSSVSSFQALPADVKDEILARWHEAFGRAVPPVTEDTMPGELANIIAGRVANVLNLRGTNFTTDAACASSFAAVQAAIDVLVRGQCDAVVTGGVDRNMGVTSFVKFSKIGALSATGTRPFGDGADGFVMGEGSAAFLLKRLADAERDGDRIYAVLRGVGGSSDGKGKGITAPNPAGQRLAIARAWQDAGLDPATATLVEAHGTSTKVGDVVEVESLAEVFGGAPRGSIAIGSAKSNVGHLKAGAGAAGLLKAVLSVHHKMLPPTLHAEVPNPSIDFPNTPFFLSRELREWERRNGTPRRCGVSAYGFGGTNFHLVLEEHVPGMLTSERKATVAVSARVPAAPAVAAAGAAPGKEPLRPIAALGAESGTELREKLEALLARVRDGYLPPLERPSPAVLASKERLLVDFGSAAELLDRLQKAEKAIGFDTPPAWKALAAQGIFRGSGPAPGRVAFLFPGQGSQYVNMGRDLAEREAAPRAVFAEADAVTAPLLGKPVTGFIFVDGKDADAVKAAEHALMQTAITQPAMLSTDLAIAALLKEYGLVPDVVMGHSLGEYAALVVSGILPFAHALEAAAARGREMTNIRLEDNGCMAAVMAPLDVVDDFLARIDGYVVKANINSVAQCVIGGETKAVEQAVKTFKKAGYAAVKIQVSHAFHTRIVAPASEPLGIVLDRLLVGVPKLPLVANVTGELYPTAVPEIKEILKRQIASPVQWVKGLETLYAEGVRTFVEVGPKKSLKGFTDDVLGHRPDLVSLATNHPKPSQVQTFNHALCGLWAAGHGAPAEATATIVTAGPEAAAPLHDGAFPVPPAPTAEQGGPVPQPFVPPASLESVTQLLAQALGRLGSGPAAALDRNATPAGSVVVSGTGLGLPGAEKPVMDPGNAERILRGEQFVDLIPERFRKKMVRKNVTRVVKSEDGSGHFETIEDTADVIKLAGRPGPFDLAAEYGVPEKLVEALDLTSQLAMAAGLDALREAGIPLVQTWKKTSKGTWLPERWMLPESLRDETGVIFACAFPGIDHFAGEVEKYYTYEARRERLAELEELGATAQDPGTRREIQRRVNELKETLAREPYVFDRRFLFQTLAMGHSQFAEYVGARGPNTQVNAACASTATGISVAEDWIRSGRCRRVLVLGADAPTSDHLMEWMGAGFLATGAVATDDKLEEAALPFDRRRHGTLMGMGACALLVEAQDAVEERGMRGLVELLTTETRNSAFHGTRLDVDHIADVMESLVTSAERRFGLNRQVMAPETVFMSHETFTPARGGSASAEVFALRKTFGASASEIVVANTKGFTGHPFGVGIEDVIAVKILEHGIVPPVPNFREVDPELGRLTLSRGGRYPVKYALHLAAGFGSQISMTLTRRIPGGLDRVDNRLAYRRWLADVTGQDQAETEVVKRVLRVVSEGGPAPRVPSGSRWLFGTGPSRRAAAPGDALSSGRPAPMPYAAMAPLAAPSAPPPHRPEDAPAPPAEAPAPAAVRASAPSPAAPAVAAAPAADPVVARVAAIVAEKTGYPPDMLDMDLDLEADLGVDTVKQAEVFAAVREEYGIERQENVKLRDFPTMRHVVKFVHDNRPDLAGAAASPVAPTEAAPPAPAPAAPAAAPAPVDPVVARVVGIVAEKTGYPPEMLDPDLDLEADLGVDTVKQAEVFSAVREAYGIERQESLKLRDFPTMRHVVTFVYDNRPDLAPPAVSASAPSVAPAAVPLASAPAPAAQAPAAPGAFPAPAPAVVAVAVAVVDDPVVAKVVEIVAEKTGYPPEMLDPDLDLEADLGVDTVKQAEVFAAVRETYGIERKEDLKLRDFPTMRHVVQFVYDFRPDLAASAREPHAAPAAAPAAEEAAEEAEGGPAPGVALAVPAPSTVTDVSAADAVPRRVPVPVLRPPLALAKPTGVHLAAGSRVVVRGDRGGVAGVLAALLSARGVDVLPLDDDAPAALETRAKAILADGAVEGVFWLPALDAEPPLASLDLAAFREANRVRVKGLYTVMRVLYDAVSRPGTFLVTGTRLGGLHGYGPEGATAPLGGAVTGFTKAYRRERPEALVKAVDFSLADAPEKVARALIEEALNDPGAIEIGRRDGLRFAISFEERAAADGGAGMTLGKDSVFLVTGAAGGITSAIVADLAAASGGTFWLLDLVPEPRRDDPRIALFRRDRETLKRALIGEAKGRGEKPTPVAIEKEVLGVERLDAALRAVEAVEAAGGTAVYRSANLLDGAAVSAAVGELAARHGKLDVLVHAGGIEISRNLPEKEPGEFDLVFDIKADGFFSLLSALRDVPLGATVVFSSVAGRFGNAGQTDYSAANDLLCKLTSHLGSARRGTRAIAIDWTAWGGIGMATRGSIPKIMEAAGIDMLPPGAGVPTVRRELTVGSGAREVVVAGKLGILAREWDETGGLDPGKAKSALRSRDRRLLMLGEVKGLSLHEGLSVETTLDPAVQPFLFDHAIEGVPLLPGVMGTETFAELAAFLCPGFHLASLEEVSFERPFKYFRMQPQTFHLSARAVPGEEGELLVSCALTSVTQAKPELPPQVREHFRGRVRMSRTPSGKPSVAFTPPSREALPVGRDTVYRIYFHGPAYQVLEAVRVDGGTSVGLMADGLPPNAEPSRVASLVAPRLLELCFQAAGLWEVWAMERMALPTAVTSVTCYRQPEEASGRRLYALVSAVGNGASFDARVVDEAGDVYLDVTGYRTVALPGRVTLAGE